MNICTQLIVYIKRMATAILRFDRPKFLVCEYSAKSYEDTWIYGYI